jgi:hypothetical protein
MFASGERGARGVLLPAPDGELGASGAARDALAAAGIRNDGVGPGHGCAGQSPLVSGSIAGVVEGSRLGIP